MMVYTCVGGDGSKSMMVWVLSKVATCLLKRSGLILTLFFVVKGFGCGFFDYVLFVMLINTFNLYELSFCSFFIFCLFFFIYLF